MNPSGNLSGIPSTAGSYVSEFRAIYTDGSQASQTYTFEIFGGSPEVTIDSPQSAGATSLSVDYEVTATGGMTPGCTWLPILLIKVRICTNGSIVLIWCKVWAKGVHSSKDSMPIRFIM